MADEQADKTEPATPKRREDARKRGDVAQSRELASVLILATALVAGGSSLGVDLAATLAAQAREAWGSAAHPGSLRDFHAALLAQGYAAGRALLPLLALLMAAAALAPLVQTGPLFSLEALQLRPERLDPIAGLRRLVNAEKLIELAKAALKIALVAAVVWAVLRPQIPMLLSLSAAGLGDGLATAGSVARRVATRALATLGLLALFDVGYQRWRHERRLRMSLREVRDEAKQREGDPRARGRFRARQLELTRARMIAAVAEAHVVVTNPTRFAVALRYEREEMRAPKLVAKGRNHVAERIRQAARAHGVPIVENPPLARALHRSVEVGREVPEALFQAVAEVLAYVYRLEPRLRSTWGSGG